MSDGKKDVEETEMDAAATDSTLSAAEDLTAEADSSDADAGKTEDPFTEETPADDFTEASAEEAVEEDVAEDAQDADAADATPAEEHGDPHDHGAHDDHDYEDDTHGSSPAAKALIALLLLLAGGAIALIGGPKLAPMLPAGIAAYLTPGASADVEELETRIAALESGLGGQVSSVQAELAASIEQSAAANAELAARLEASEAVLSNLESADAAALATRIDDAEAALAGLREELRALTAAPGVEGGSVSDAAISGLRAELSAINQNAAKALEDRVAPLEQEVATIDARLDAAEAQVAAGAASGREGATSAAFAVLSATVNSAAPYEKELETFTAVSGVDAPEALQASAAAGAPSLTSLRATFPDAATAAISAATKAAAGEGYAEQALAWVKSQVAIRPVDEEEGDAPAAVLSRADARLNEGALKAALAELDALPTVSKDAMSGWVARAQARASVDAALADLAVSMLPGAAASN